MGGGGRCDCSPSGCEAFAFELHSDGEIFGHVTSPDGRPLKIHPWVDISSEDGRVSRSFDVDDRGHYEARGLEPGRYPVGIGIQATTDSPEWRSRVYYPGVRTRKKAVVIELGKAAKRANVDFTISPTP